nr:hypothetical protein [Gemmatimonadota bacterium]
MMRLYAAAILALLATAACEADRTPVGPTSSAAFLPCVFGTPLNLQVGEVVTGSGADLELLCLGAGAEGAEFTLV